MKVSTNKPFKIIYSLFAHEYLGFLFESFAVQLDEQGRFTFEHQNISSKNAHEFAKELDERDDELIRLMDSMQQEVIISKFHKKKIKTHEFFSRIYGSNRDKSQQLQEEIDQYLENIRARILPLLYGKKLFEMSNDGEPAGKEIEVMPQKATVLFHFRRNEESTLYFPTIKYDGEKLDFQYKNAYLICKQPAWMVLGGKLYSFEKDIDGNKLQPFLNKKFIIIPKKVEDSYYYKFVAPMVASFDVYAKGFNICTEKHKPVAYLSFYELQSAEQEELFDNSHNGTAIAGKEVMSVSDKICFELTFHYGPYEFEHGENGRISVIVDKQDDQYTFHRIVRDLRKEKNILLWLKNNAVTLRNSKAVVPKGEAFSWINSKKHELESEGIVLQQRHDADHGKKYFLGGSSIDIEIKENIDWFDIYAKVKFGTYEVPFRKIRSLILHKQREFVLPNGEIAVIPEVWFTEYSELFAFTDQHKTSGEEIRLKKYHMALVEDLQSGNLAKVTMDRKLDRLKTFDKIEDYPMPGRFKGTLRPYQKAGYNWMNFLNNFNFGGCLADDMGLGKTVQTLALLQKQKEQYQKNNTRPRTSLLVMPTSLIYNWEMEAKKFTPSLKVFTYTGTNRNKCVEQFQKYDLVLTSYGIVRLDIDILKDYYFNYVILDESQAIKNPDSNIAQAVRVLNSKFRLILTGTPLENSTLDLWSQMSFINPGLLGNQTFFRNEFVNPIEKKGDAGKTEKLNTIIKPFILRRQKWQVATELPEKIENIQYCTMTEEQEACYEEAKSFYRNEILNLIETEGIQKSQLLLLQGLTKLRQIANHPSMVDESYSSNSGKLEDILHMLSNAIGEGHKILIFSQFVKHLTLLADKLKQREFDFAYLDGSTRNRKEQVERFQNDDSLKLFLISLRAGGVGLNLTKADYVFILDPWWNPAVEAQAIDRAHRIGQESKVFTYKFITRNTVEEKILKLQQSKIRLATELISAEESFVKKLTKEDISAILE